RGGSGSCPLAGFLVALAFLEGSPVQRHVIVYLGDGGGTCPGSNEQQYLQQTLQSVTQANGGRAEIHTIGVLMQGRGMQESFLRQLAEANGGRYRRIN
ncbi:MAG: hypothetical protein O7J95_17265, partial [Planctomycetota bacterium]|nr:hypothetical protein [Planctomycetota bacterium]